MSGKIVVRSGMLLLIFAGAILLPVRAQVLPPQAQTPSRIVSLVDNSVRVTISQSTHPWAKPAYDVGPLDGSTPLDRMILVLAGSPEQELRARTLLDSQQTKGSPDYHHWLTPEEVGARFGPSSQDIQQVTGWLQQQGFSVGGVSRSGRWIEFSGTAAQVETAFQTRMRQYQIGGNTHIANSADISIPEALSPVVRGVVSLHDFFKKPLLTPYFQVHRNNNGELVPVNPKFSFPSGTIFHFLAPGDYAKIYDLNSLYQSGANGAGQTIAIVGRSKVDVTDVAAFRQIFNLPAASLKMIINGTDPGVTFDAIEATLDVEWSAAVAPQATVDLVVSASTTTTDGVDLSSAYIVDNNLAPIMSVSFGGCEKNLGTAINTFYNNLWQQAAAQGISVFVSSGDNGAAGCDDPNDFQDVPARGGLAVSGLASTPFNTAVGGTEFNENGNDSVFWSVTNGPGFFSANGYIPEVVWNESCDPTIPTSPCAGQFFNLFAGSGGASSLYSKPSWQSLSIPGVPNDNQRDLPDVSLAGAGGHDGYLLCVFGFCQTTIDSSGNPVLLSAAVAGGTSASSPSFAGIMAIIDQQTGGRQGLANYGLYPLAAKENFSNCNSSNRTNPGAPTSCVFNDITAGNNNVPGQTGFNAGNGYDLASGLGSVDAANLVSAWVNLAKGFQGTTIALSANGSTSVQHGQPISFTVAVKPIAGSATPTGNVSFLTSLTGAAGAGSVVTVGAGALANGSFIGSLSNLPGGQYNVSAHYPGDGTFQASDSNAVAVSISKENSSTGLSSFIIDPKTGNLIPGTTAAYGDFVEIHSAVTSASGQGFASGSMTVTDGNSQLAVLPLNSAGQADIVSSGFGGQVTLTVGSHTLNGSYSGDNSFNSSSTTQPLTVNITKATPFILLTATQFSVPQGQPVTIAALVFNLGPILPTGTVQFLDGNTPLGSPVQLSSPSPGALSQAGLQTSFTTVGNHTISANYSGDSTYNATPSQASILLIVTSVPSGNAPFQFSAVGGNTAATIQAGQTATFNISLVANLGFAGTVAITCSGAPGGSTCAANPAAVNFNGSNANVPLTVTVSNTQNARLAPLKLRGLPIVFAGIFAGLFGVLQKRRRAALMFLALCVMAGVSACGGGGGSSAGAPPTNATLTVTGTSGSQSASIMLNLTILH